MKVRNVTRIIICIWTTVFFLSGCMYPNERRVENQLPVIEQVAKVQEGVNQFVADHQILPILTKEAGTPILEKYVIDWKRMVPGYLPYIPGAAFEQGGSYLFVLTNVEDHPQVRLLDLKIAHKVGEVQSRVSYYFHKNKSLPVEGVVNSSYFRIDFSKIGMASKDGTIESPFTGGRLPVIMSSKGIVGIDYTSDLELMLKSNQVDLESGRDLRFIFTDHSIYVPVKAFPFILQDGKPQLAPEPEK